MDQDVGGTDILSTSTEELSKQQPGFLNQEFTLKVVKKDYCLPDVQKKGTFSKLFLHLTNDEEERVKMVAFGATADRINTLFEANALVNFTGIEVVPIYSEQNRYGGMDYELKATGASDATMIVPNYRPASGMPFSKTADIDSANPHQRLKFKVRLVNDFAPHGTYGLTGQANIKDSSGQRLVYVQLIKVAASFKTHFRAGANMVFKGSIKKFASTNGFVYRFIVDSESDVEFEGDISRYFGGTEGGSSTSFAKRAQASPAVVERYTPASTGRSSSLHKQAMRKSASSPPSASENMVLTGQIIADFEPVDDHYWGMIQVAHESYEVTLLDVPEGAEALFLEDVEVTVRGRLQGYAITVRRWKDVTIDGCEAFSVEADTAAEIAKAMDLRKLQQPEERTIQAKLLNYSIDRDQLRITALVHDETKVVVKLTAKEVPSDMRLPGKSFAGAFFQATGSVVCCGAFCEMIVELADALEFQVDGRTVTPSKAVNAGPSCRPTGSSVLPKGVRAADIPLKLKKVKQEKPEDLAIFDNHFPSGKQDASAATPPSSNDVVELDDTVEECPVKPLAKGKAKASAGQQTSKRKSADESGVVAKKSKGAPLALQNVTKRLTRKELLAQKALAAKNSASTDASSPPDQSGEGSSAPAMQSLAGKDGATSAATVPLEEGMTTGNESSANVPSGSLDDDDVPYLSPSTTSIVPPATTDRLRFDKNGDDSASEPDSDA